MVNRRTGENGLKQSSSQSNNHKRRPVGLDSSAAIGQNVIFLKNAKNFEIKI